MPWNISRFTMKWAGRGARPITTGPSISPEWFAAMMSGPVAGTRSSSRIVVR